MAGKAEGRVRFPSASGPFLPFPYILHFRTPNLSPDGNFNGKINVKKELVKGTSERQYDTWLKSCRLGSNASSTPY